MIADDPCTEWRAAIQAADGKMIWGYFDESGLHDRKTGRLLSLTLGGGASRARKRGVNFPQAGKPLCAWRALPCST